MASSGLFIPGGGGGGSVAPLSVAGVAGFFGGINHFLIPETTVSSSTGFSATAGFFLMFYLPVPVTITKAVVSVTAVSASASKQLSVGIYPASAGSSLLASGVFNVSTGQATGVRSVTIAQTSVTLPAGFYYYVATMNATDVNMVFFNGYPASSPMNIGNQNGTRGGTVAVATPGTLDATLGVLTKSASVGGNLILSFFES
jgi:hypothetical protein